MQSVVLEIRTYLGKVHIPNYTKFVALRNRKFLRKCIFDHENMKKTLSKEAYFS